MVICEYRQDAMMSCCYGKCKGTGDLSQGEQTRLTIETSLISLHHGFLCMLALASPEIQHQLRQPRKLQPRGRLNILGLYQRSPVLYLRPPVLCSPCSVFPSFPQTGSYACFSPNRVQYCPVGKQMRDEHRTLCSTVTEQRREHRSLAP